MADAITNVNAKIVGSLTSIDWMTVIGWIVFIIVAVAGGFLVYNYYRNKKIFNLKITAKERIGDEWIPTITDEARVVKIGKGGFQLLFLRKLKIYKLAYRKIGRRDYVFYIMPDGYWYNGYEKADLQYMDEHGGYHPVLSTHPSMRGQYTSLEKQIESLHGEKATFWDKYGSWVMSIAFVLIAGVMLWLSYKEFAGAMGQFTNFLEKMNGLIEKLNVLQSNAQASTIGNSGLVQV